MKDFSKIIMNPVRMRIVQFLMLNNTGTSGEIHAELCDIPTASLYRHIKILLEAGLIEVAEERQIRGTVERVYKLNPNPLGEPAANDISTLFQTSMLALMSDFSNYFANPDNDPQRDMLSFGTSTLLMTDEEYIQFFTKLGEMINDVIANKPAEGRKIRRITFISSPTTTDKTEA